MHYVLHLISRCFYSAQKKENESDSGPFSLFFEIKIPLKTILFSEQIKQFLIIRDIHNDIVVDVDAELS